MTTDVLVAGGWNKNGGDLGAAVAETDANAVFRWIGRMPWVRVRDQLTGGSQAVLRLRFFAWGRDNIPVGRNDMRTRFVKTVVGLANLGGTVGVSLGVGSAISSAATSSPSSTTIPRSSPSTTAPWDQPPLPEHERCQHVERGGLLRDLCPRSSHNCRSRPAAGAREHSTSRDPSRAAPRDAGVSWLA